MFRRSNSGEHRHSERLVMVGDVAGQPSRLQFRSKQEGSAMVGLILTVILGAAFALPVVATIAARRH
jgi:hypothetical protein